VFYACDIIQTWLIFSSRQFKEIKEFKEFKENEEAATNRTIPACLPASFRI
jgi:hypothetical protein